MLWPRPAQILLVVTERCNCRCVMCEVGRAAAGAPPGRGRGQELSLATLRALLADPYLSRHKIPFYIAITEPLLHTDIGGIIRRIKERHHPVKLVTNGLLLGPRARELARSGLDAIQLSLDGPPQVHDAVRGVPGLYGQALDGLRRLKAQAPALPVHISTVVSPATHRHLLPLWRGLGASGIPLAELKLQFLHFVTEQMAARSLARGHAPALVGRLALTEDRHLQGIDAAALLAQLSHLRAGRAPHLGRVRTLPDLRGAQQIRDYFHPRGEPLGQDQRCLWPYTLATVRPGGDVLFHHRCPAPVIGNIHAAPLLRLYNGRAAREARRSLGGAGGPLPPFCARCCGLFYSNQASAGAT